MNLENGVENYLYAVNSINYGFIWSIVSIVIAIAGGLVLYFTLLRKKAKMNGFLGKVRDFLTFKTLLIEELLKVSYITIALFITLYSFKYIVNDTIYFLILLIGGNIMLRLAYELTTVILNINKNTKEINEKLKK